MNKYQYHHSKVDTISLTKVSFGILRIDDWLLNFIKNWVTVREKTSNFFPMVENTCGASPRHNFMFTTFCYFLLTVQTLADNMRVVCNSYQEFRQF